MKNNFYIQIVQYGNHEISLKKNYVCGSLSITSTWVVAQENVLSFRPLKWCDSLVGCKNNEQSHHLLLFQWWFRSTTDYHIYKLCSMMISNSFSHKWCQFVPYLMCKVGTWDFYWSSLLPSSLNNPMASSYGNFWFLEVFAHLQSTLKGQNISYLQNLWK